MTSTKRVLLILAMLFGTPALGLAISYIGSVIHGYDDGSGIAAAAGLFVGILGVVASLILGSIVSFAMRNSSRQMLSLIGYFIPSGIALLYILILSLIVPY